MAEGIWYHVYLHPGWRLEVANEAVSHEVFWKRHVVPILVAHYGLDAERAKAAETLHLAFPRGRYVLTPPNLVTLTRGAFPFPLDIVREQRRIISAFRLHWYAVKDLDRWEESAEFGVDPEQQVALLALIGVAVPS